MPSGGRRENAGRPAKAIPTSAGIRAALYKAMEEVPRIQFPIRPPDILPGVVPAGVNPKVQADTKLAMDAVGSAQFGSQLYGYSNVEGFPGYPYLAALALRVEYRNMAAALSNEMTREWIEFTSSETAGEKTKNKITELEQAFRELNVQAIIRRAFEEDAFYGTGQILININGADLTVPLTISEKTIKKNGLDGFKNVEPIWTTPLMYNALDPSRKDFYNPSGWWVMGQHWDATRMLRIVTRPVPDIFKPAFNFSGISLSQLVEPYVNNWLRTRQSVSDLINNFSILSLKTAMDQVLSGGDDGTSLFNRIKLFTATRSNKGVMVLDKDREELEQLAVPLGGLHELQAQAQEQMCTASREPAVIMTGVSPSGFGNVAEGEMSAWRDWIRANQEGHARDPIETILKIVQLSMFGSIDPEIGITFNPLYQMTEEQLSTIRTNDSIRAGNLIDRGVIDPQEERERLARDPESGYTGLDIDKEIAPPDEAEESANLGRGTDSALGYDADFQEEDHPRDTEGKFALVRSRAGKISVHEKPLSYFAENPEALNELFNELGAGEYTNEGNSTGIRGLSSNEIGKRLKKSRIWDDGNPTRKTLRGTSVVAHEGDFSSQEPNEKSIQNIISLVKDYGGGEAIALIQGMLMKDEDFNDTGESVIGNPKVLAYIINDLHYAHKEKDLGENPGRGKA